LQFRYPDEEKAEFEGEINQLQRTFLGNTAGDAVRWNYDYSFYGSKNIAPIQAVDNGTFTIFKFPKHSVVPAIFAVDRHQNESLVNFRVEGDYVFVQGVRHQYTLRNGEDVTTVYNDSFRLN
ncbi:MAG: conjugal transfer protein, partial [Gammaproteobacteria bacterium]